MIDWSYDYQDNNICQQVTPKQEQTSKIFLKLDYSIHLFVAAQTNIHLYICIHDRSYFYLIYIWHTQKHMHAHILTRS